MKKRFYYSALFFLGLLALVLLVEASVINVINFGFKSWGIYPTVLFSIIFISFVTQVTANNFFPKSELKYFFRENLNLVGLFSLIIDSFIE